MKEWFIAGYFTQNLLVKRACDPQFIALGQLIDRWGEMPFDKKHGLSPQVDYFCNISAARLMILQNV